MPTKLIRLKNNVLVEVEAATDAPQLVSGGLADRVQAATDTIVPVLLSTLRPIADSWTELSENVLVSEAEIQLGLSFDMEGNVYVAKTKASANLSVKITFKPRP